MLKIGSVYKTQDSFVIYDKNAFINPDMYSSYNTGKSTGYYSTLTILDYKTHDFNFYKGYHIILCLYENKQFVCLSEETDLYKFKLVC